MNLCYFQKCLVFPSLNYFLQSYNGNHFKSHWALVRLETLVAVQIIKELTRLFPPQISMNCRSIS